MTAIYNANILYRKRINLGKLVTGWETISAYDRERIENVAEIWGRGLRISWPLYRDELERDEPLFTYAVSKPDASGNIFLDFAIQGLDAGAVKYIDRGAQLYVEAFREAKQRDIQVAALFDDFHPNATLLLTKSYI